MKGSTWVHILDASDVVLQSVKFHTSCSQPLCRGDQFGSVVPTGFVPVERALTGFCIYQYGSVNSVHADVTCAV